MSIDAKTAILDHLGRQHQAMVGVLADLVNIDSGSYNKRGVDAVGDRLRAFLEAAGIPCETFPHEVFGNCMAARVPASGGGNRPIVLMGHRDTVFPDGTAAQRPFRIDGNQAFGPGVADMKSGLVMNTFVLEAFHRFGAPCPVTGLYTSDEEIASPSSRPVIEAEARDARAVFNSEPGRPSGNLVTRRRVRQSSPRPRRHPGAPGSCPVAAKQGSTPDLGWRASFDWSPPAAPCTMPRHGGTGMTIPL